MVCAFNHPTEDSKIIKLAVCMRANLCGCEQTCVAMCVSARV